MNSKRRLNALLALSLIIGVVILFSCKSTSYMQHQKRIHTTSSGMTIEWIHQQESGRTVEKGDQVSVHYTGKFSNDSVFDSSIKRGVPFQFMVGAGEVIKGWDELMPMLQVGDRVKVVLPPELAYGSRKVGSIPPNSTLIFEIEVVKTTKPRQVEPWILTSADTIALPSGLKYIIHEKGKGPIVAYGRRVSVHYIGYLPDGSKFDSSYDRGKPIEFVAGAGSVIKGWDQGVMKLHKGERARLIIPASMGYGNKQVGPIPANSTLIFDVEIVDVRD